MTTPIAIATALNILGLLCLVVDTILNPVFEPHYRVEDTGKYGQVEKLPAGKMIHAHRISFLG
jgi:hypothetical protein